MARLPLACAAESRLHSRNLKIHRISGERCLSGSASAHTLEKAAGKNRRPFLLAAQDASYAPSCAPKEVLGIFYSRF